jgi:hypothetical protein
MFNLVIVCLIYNMLKRTTCHNANDNHQIYRMLNLQQTNGMMLSHLPFRLNRKTLSSSRHLNVMVRRLQQKNIYVIVPIFFFGLFSTFSRTSNKRKHGIDSPVMECMLPYRGMV